MKTYFNITVRLDLVDLFLCKRHLDRADVYGYYFTMSNCHACGFQFDDGMKVFRSSECPSCGRDIKVCLNCKFYSPGSNMDCREDISEAVIDKDKANFCDYFKLGDGTSGGTVQKKADKARSEFDSLFND